MSGWRVPLRLARRESRRRPWRSLLVVILVAVPVAGTSIATVLARTDARDALEHWDDTWGAADAVTYNGSSLEELVDAGVVPADVERTATWGHAYVPMRSADAVARTQTLALDPGDPIWQGRFTVRSGRAPSAPAEVALNPRLADRFGVDAGDELRLERPALTVQVSGIIEDRNELRSDLAFVAPGVGASLLPPGSEERLLVDLGDATDAQLQPLLFRSVDVRPLPSLARFEPDSPFERVAWSVVVGALVLAVAGIVIAAAFAAGGRSQLVSLGQLAANGAPPAVLRRVLVLQGTVTGAVGTVAGGAIALVALLRGRELFELALGRRIDAYSVGAGELLAIAALGIAGATIAALVPSRTVTSVPTLAALAGRRPVAPVRPRFTAGGLISMAGGFVLLVVAAAGASGGQAPDLFAAVAIAGGVAMLFGAAALTPAMVERLEPLARRAGGSVRLALRGLARNRVRSGAIVASVAAAGALAVGAASFAPATTDDVSYLRLPDDVIELSTFSYTEERVGAVPDDAVAEVAGALSDPVVHRTRMLQGNYQVQGIDYGFVGEEALVVDLGLASTLELTPVALRALRDDGVVVLAFNPRPTQRVQVQGPDGSVEGAVTFSPRGVLRSAGLLVTPEAAERLGGTVQPGPVYVADADGIDDLERFDLDDIATAYWSWDTTETTDGAPAVEMAWHVPSSRFDGSHLVPLLTAVAVVFALLVVGAGLALAAADDRTDRRLLSVVGAGPRMLAATSGAQAAVLALLGLLLSVPLGHLPVVAIQTAVSTQELSEFPLPTVAGLLIGVPLAAALGATAVAAAAQRLRPLRVSTTSFE